MTEKEALKYFAKYIQSDCPVEECEATAGKLCNSPAVWVHLERMKIPSEAVEL